MTPQKMDSLFDLAPASADWTDTDLSAMLRHQLDAPADFDARFPTIRALLSASDPPIDALEALKRLAKVQRSQPHPAIPPDLWRVIYFASIAAAHHAGRSISDLSADELAAGFHWALNITWLDADIRDLIQRGLGSA